MLNPYSPYLFASHDSFLLTFTSSYYHEYLSLLFQTSVSIKRINTFLSYEDLEPYVTRNEETDAIVVENGCFKWSSKSVALESKREVKRKIGKSDSDETSGSGQLTDKYNNSEEFSSTDINIKISKGSFVAIVGSVGSGKSTLISALLGEMECLKGRVNISADLSIAYVAQQAWIQNSTLRDNVLFGSRYDRAKYKEVISRCALDPDIAYLPGGDETEIGEKGINLSGGQKQRVSLARACYSDADLFFLDDPLSAVDAHVAKHIFDNVLSSRTGLLKNKTRVLVTNRLDILSKVDNIIVLKNGRISEMGSYQNLMDSEKEFSKLVKHFSSMSDETQDKGDVKHKTAPQSAREDVITRNQSISSEDHQENKLIEAERVEIGTVKLNVYVQYFKKVTILWVTAVILGFCMSTGLSLASNIWLSKWSSSGPNSTEDDTRYFLSIYGLLGGLQSKAFLIERKFFTRY